MNDKLKSTLTLVGIPLGGSSSILGLGTTTNDYQQIYASTTNSCKPGVDSTGVSSLNSSESKSSNDVTLSVVLCAALGGSSAPVAVYEIETKNDIEYDVIEKRANKIYDRYHKDHIPSDKRGKGIIIADTPETAVICNEMFNNTFVDEYHLVLNIESLLLAVSNILDTKELISEERKQLEKTKNLLIELKAAYTEKKIITLSTKDNETLLFILNSFKKHQENKKNNAKKLIKEKWSKMQEMSENMKRDHISESAAQCSYYTILSFIPFLILLITLIQYTGIAPQTLFDAISKIIPSSMSEMVLGIVQEVYSKSIGTISISIIFTIWTAGKGFYALTAGLQTVYQTKGKKITSYIYLRIKVLLETILFIILIVMGLIILVFGNGVVDIIKEYFGGFKNYTIISSIIAQLGFMFATFVVFLLLYKFMPKHKVTFKSQTYGALFGAVALNVISFIFSRYLTIFKGFSITYGSLTTLMLVMMWTYSCFYTVFLGAELNKFMSKN